MNRRTQSRYPILFPLTLDRTGVEQTVAVSRNISLSGLLVATPTRLEVDERVTLTFPPTTKHPTARSLQGRIVRAYPNDADPDGLWPHLAAVELDSPAPELEPMLKDLAEFQRGFASPSEPPPEA